MPTTPATRSTTLVSLATAKAWLQANGGLTETADDARIIAAFDGASEEIERATGRYFVKRTGLVQKANGDNREVLKLQFRPVVAVSSIVVSGRTLGASEFDVDTALGLVYLLTGAFTSGIRNVVVTYDAGYDAQDGAALPGDVVRAVLDLGKAIYDTLSAGATATTSVTAGPFTFSVAQSAYPAHVKRVIDTWLETRA